MQSQAFGLNKLLVLILSLTVFIAATQHAQAFDGAFIRGDCNQDSLVTRADLQPLLDYVFYGASAQCEASLDVNADQKINVDDAIALANATSSISVQFHKEIPAPFPLCGASGTGNLLSCQNYMGCRETFPITGKLPSFRLASPIRLHDCLLVDLNQDGMLDIVAASFSNSKILTYLNRGNSFEAGATLNFGERGGTYATSQGSIKAADLNGDGLPDLLVCSALSDSLSIFYTIAESQYSSPYVFTLSPSLADLEIADFNSDGLLDIAISDAFDNTISVLHRNTSGEYDLAAVMTTADRPESIAAADINSDGRIDLISANMESNTLSVFTANATGGFDNTDRINTSTRPQNIHLKDMNGDNIKDIVVLFRYPGLVSIFYGDPAGAFAPALTLPVPSYSACLLVEDFNLDGELDLITGTAQSSDNSLHINFGDGSGSFSPASEWSSRGRAINLCVGDLNGDGYNDICKAMGDYQLSIEFGNSQSTLNSEFAVQWPQEQRPNPIQDINGDGATDLISFNPNFGPLLLYYGDGNGNFTQFDSIDTGAPIRTVLVIDMNSDGILDILFTNKNLNHLGIIYGLHNGTYSQAIYSQSSYFHDYFLYSKIAIEDFNRDGFLDFALPSGNFLSSKVDILLGDNVGGFSYSGSIPLAGNVFPTFRIAKLESKDLNLDGIPDLSITQQWPGRLVSFTGKGDGRFNSEATIIELSRINQSYLADINNDGFSDSVLLTVVPPNATAIQVALNNGSGILELAAYSPVLFDFDLTPPADIDNDGFLDLTFKDNGQLKILHGDGSGQFLRHSSYDLGGFYSFSVYQDLEGDGDLDLFVVHYDFLIGGPFYEFRIGENNAIP